MSEKQNYRVLVAVDPTESELKPTEAGLLWFKKWVSDHRAHVDSVFVSSNQYGAIPVSESELSDYVKNLNLGNDVTSKILNEKSSSRRKAVETLVQYSKNAQDDLIVVSSHGRSGPGRLVLGSFAESLLAVSPVPVLFLCENADHVKPSNKMLFPTDFSKASKLALDLFLEQNSGYQGEVILFHAVPPPGAIFDTGVLGMPVYLPDSYWLELKAWTDTESEKLLKQVKEKGFNARMVVLDAVLNTPMAIQSTAQSENVDLIAMASLSRGLESAILGTVAKEIFRMRKWPVWVCGPETVFNEGKINEIK